MSIDKKVTKKALQHYIRTGGVRCPACDSEDIEGEPFEVDTSIAWQKISCNKCSSSWTDEYKLVNISNISNFEQGNLSKT